MGSAINGGPFFIVAPQKAANNHIGNQALILFYINLKKIVKLLTNGVVTGQIVQ
jgi:hypothetical protein